MVQQDPAKKKLLGSKVEMFDVCTNISTHLFLFLLVMSVHIWYLLLLLKGPGKSKSHIEKREAVKAYAEAIGNLYVSLWWRKEIWNIFLPLSFVFVFVLNVELRHLSLKYHAAITSTSNLHLHGKERQNAKSPWPLDLDLEKTLQQLPVIYLAKSKNRLK
jgi:hypothetical protein